MYVSVPLLYVPVSSVHPTKSVLASDRLMPYSYTDMKKCVHFRSSKIDGRRSEAMSDETATGNNNKKYTRQK